MTAKEKTNISITLSWISGSENFSPINGYEVIYRQTGSSDWMIARNFSDGTTTEQLVDGLMPLTDYDFRVRARNAIGEGEFSDIEKLITHPNGKKYYMYNTTVCFIGCVCGHCCYVCLHFCVVVSVI